MATIIDQLDYLEETKSLIKEAIVNKGVSVSNDDTFRSYADKINNIETGSSSEVVVDIFNHGDVQWLNPYFGNCALNGSYTSESSYRLAEKQQETSNVVRQASSNNIRFIQCYGSNMQVALPKPIYTKGYKYLCIDVQVIQRYSGTYTTFQFFDYKPYDVFMKSYYASNVQKTFAVLTWFSQGNHVSSTKRNFERNIVQFDISGLDEIILGWHQCDHESRIYSIWLSNEELDHYDFSQDYKS